MPQYRPPQRVVPARVLTPSGWLRGDIHLPRLHSLLAFLGQAAPFLALTRVALPGARDELPFLALRRSSALLILPACDPRLLLLDEEPHGFVQHLVTCLLPAGTVRGRLALEPQVRLSDFLARHEGFLLLREADLGPVRTRVPLLVVNGAALLAVAEQPRGPALRAVEEARPAVAPGPTAA